MRGYLGVTVALAAAGLLAIPATGFAGGTVSGTVSFEGEAPKARKLRLDADAVCAGSHDGPVYSEEVVVNDGKLANVFVYLKGVTGDFAAPSEPAVLDQKGCVYQPHIVGVQVGQPLKILNSDKTLHNVHGMPKINPEFNFAMPKFVKKKNTTFSKEEVMVAMKCDVHPWMSGYVGILPHPFFAVSGADGSFSIADAPAGNHAVVAWHEKYGTQEGTVTVSDGGSATLDFTFSPS